MNIPVDNNAPVKSEAVIEIYAPAEIVWHVLTHVENWPDWQKNVTESNLEGDLKVGTRFRWKAGGISFISEIHTMKRLRMFGWTGKTIGTSAVHNWILTEDKGITKVQVEESLQGTLPRLFKKNFQKNLDTGMRKSLEELKTASEKSTNTK